MNLRTRMEKTIIASYNNTAGIIVLCDGMKVYENYYNGCNAGNTIHVASVTKSIMSILIGIAIDEGVIHSLDDNLLQYFPKYKVPQGEMVLPQVTIRDVMTMTAPYKCKTEPYKKVLTGTGWVNAALNIIGGRQKTGKFIYSPLVGIHVLSGILTKATGRHILDYAREKLFVPMGIEVKSDISLKNEEENMAFLKSRVKSGWVTDPEGINTAGWGLTLTTADMAKIGQLYLDNGKMQCMAGNQNETHQIVSADWVSQSTSVHSHWDKLKYGFLWWVIDENEQAFAAMGDGGNTIYVNSDRKLVVAISALYQPKAKDRLKLIKDYIEPLFGENK